MTRLAGSVTWCSVVVTLPVAMRACVLNAVPLHDPVVVPVTFRHGYGHRYCHTVMIKL